MKRSVRAKHAAGFDVAAARARVRALLPKNVDVEALSRSRPARKSAWIAKAVVLMDDFMLQERESAPVRKLVQAAESLSKAIAAFSAAANEVGEWSVADALHSHRWARWLGPEHGIALATMRISRATDSIHKDLATIGSVLEAASDYPELAPSGAPAVLLLLRQVEYCLKRARLKDAEVAKLVDDGIGGDLKTKISRIRDRRNKKLWIGKLPTKP